MLDGLVAVGELIVFGGRNGSGGLIVLVHLVMTAIAEDDAVDDSAEPGVAGFVGVAGLVGNGVVASSHSSLSDIPQTAQRPNWRRRASSRTDSVKSKGRPLMEVSLWRVIEGGWALQRPITDDR